MAERRYYWLKLKEDFFESKRIKKLRKLAGGDTLTIIYLKMQLKSIKTDGTLTYTGLEKTFAEELALDLDENPDDVGLLLNYLAATGLIETSDNINFFLPWAVANTGSESASAERMRNLRLRQSSQSDGDVTQALRIGDGEKEIEKEKEKETDKDRPSVLNAPSYHEVVSFAMRLGLMVDPHRFWCFFQNRSWMWDGKPVENWQGLLISWDKARLSMLTGEKIDPIIAQVLAQMETSP